MKKPAAKELQQDGFPEPRSVQKQKKQTEVFHVYISQWGFVRGQTLRLLLVVDALFTCY